MNIYLKVSGEYYYSDTKQNKTDTKVEHHVGTEYAYNFCSSHNFGSKNSCVTKQADPRPTHHPNETWRREHTLMRQLR